MKCAFSGPQRLRTLLLYLLFWLVTCLSHICDNTRRTKRNWLVAATDRSKRALNAPFRAQSVWRVVAWRGHFIAATAAERQNSRSWDLRDATSSDCCGSRDTMLSVSLPLRKLRRSAIASCASIGQTIRRSICDFWTLIASRPILQQFSTENQINYKIALLTYRNNPIAACFHPVRQSRSTFVINRLQVLATRTLLWAVKLFHHHYHHHDGEDGSRPKRLPHPRNSCKIINTCSQNTAVNYVGSRCHGDQRYNHKAFPDQTRPCHADPAVYNSSIVPPDITVNLSANSHHSIVFSRLICSIDQSLHH